MKYKKILLTAPMVMMLGTPVICSPMTALAAETTNSNTVSQVSSVLGYLVKDGVKTPVYQSSKVKRSGPYSPDFPTLSSNPLEAVPKEGTTITESGNMGDILYFEGNGSVNDKQGKYYLKKRPNHNNDIEFGVYDPITYELYPVNSEEAVYGSDDSISHAMQVALQDGINKEFSKAFDGHTKVKRETKYELIDSAITDSVVAYQYNKSVSSGISTADQFGFAATLGWKVAATVGGGVLPGSVTAEMSGSLTANYGHSITVNSSDTRTHQFSVGKVDNPSYPYNKYTVATYQLRSTYTAIPGDGLQSVLSSRSMLKGLSNTVYKYSEDQLYFGVTPGSHI